MAQQVEIKFEEQTLVRLCKDRLNGKEFYTVEWYTDAMQHQISFESMKPAADLFFLLSTTKINYNYEVM